jgi:DNA primase
MPHGFVSFAEVKRAVSIEAVLGRYELLENLTRKGANLAGPCPFCKGRSARQFQVNLTKGAWYCFGCKQGGNVLDFVAKREGVKLRAAAITLDSWFELGLVDEAPRSERRAAPTETPLVAEEILPTENPPLTFTLKTLDPCHANLAPLGLQTSTIQLFEAGYCTKGLLRERMAIPIHNVSGALVAYVGLALNGEAPRYLFPPKFHAALEVMNLHRLANSAEEGGTLYLVPEIAGVLHLTDAFSPVLGLFDGSLSSAQEEAIAGAVTLYERLVLVGEGFSDRTVARLARHTAVLWVSDLARDPEAEEVAEPLSLGEEGA